MARPKLAVILTQYGSKSHGMCICSKLLEGLEFDDHTEEPRCDVVAVHLMEVADDDIGVALCERHGVPMYPTVASALCRGGDELAVDGVVLIGEHGTWPYNERGSHLYPRRELFDQIVGVYRQAGRVVPLFCDKHWTWNWAWARYMRATIEDLQIPFMAGSSGPWATFEPFVPLPRGHAYAHTVGLGWGPFEAYGFHVLEVTQFLAEQRAGGESGVARVRCLSGNDVLDIDAPSGLVEAALEAAQAELTPGPETFAIEAEHIDGHRTTALIVNPGCNAFAFAYTGRTGVVAAGYPLDDPPRVKHFSPMVRAIEQMMLDGVAPIPLERTYLTTGVIAYALESRFQGGIWLDAEGMDIAYQPAALPAAWSEVLR